MAKRIPPSQSAPSFGLDDWMSPDSLNARANGLTPSAGRRTMQKIVQSSPRMTSRSGRTELDRSKVSWRAMHKILHQP